MQFYCLRSECSIFCYVFLPRCVASSERLRWLLPLTIFIRWRRCLAMTQDPSPSKIVASNGNLQSSSFILIHSSFTHQSSTFCFDLAKWCDMMLNEAAWWIHTMSMWQPPFHGALPWTSAWPDGIQSASFVEYWLLNNEGPRMPKVRSWYRFNSCHRVWNHEISWVNYVVL